MIHKRACPFVNPSGAFRPRECFHAKEQRSWTGDFTDRETPDCHIVVPKGKSGSHYFFLLSPIDLPGRFYPPKPLKQCRWGTTCFLNG